MRKPFFFGSKSSSCYPYRKKEAYNWPRVEFGKEFTRCAFTSEKRRKDLIVVVCENCNNFP